MLTFPAVAMVALLTALIAEWYVAGTTVHIRLYQNNIVPGPGDTFATFTEASFNGYAAGSLVKVGTVFTNAAGQAEQDFQLTNFTATNGAVPNTIYGYYVGIKVGAGAESLLWAERFAAPVVINAAGQQINVSPQLTGVSAF